MMLSRMADALFWMARYLERADNTARLLEINLLHLVETEEGPFGSAQWRPLLQIGGTEGLFAERLPNSPIDRASVVRFMTQDLGNPNSLLHTVRLARENARVVRDRISKEMWESVNDLWLWADAQLKSPLSIERAPLLYNQLRQRTARFHGLTASTMMRGEAYGFYRLGSYLERADMTARILDVKYYILLPDVKLVGSALDYYQWAALLKSLSGFEAFRRLYHAGLRPLDVAEFVVFNPEFPRSLFFCFDRLEKGLAYVNGLDSESPSWKALRDLKATLLNQSATQLFQSGLHESLQDIERRIARLGQALQADYFEAHRGDRVALPH